MQPRCIEPVRLLRRPLPDEDKRRRELDDATLKDLRLGHIAKFVQTMDLLAPGWKATDPRLKARLEEMLTDVMFSEGHTTSISTIARELGIVLDREQLIKVGAAVARMYREKNKSAPPKKSLQWADGQDRKVNVYTDEDRDLIVTALLSTSAAAAGFQ